MKKIIIAAGLCTSMVASAATTTTMYGFLKGSYTMSDKIAVGAGKPANAGYKPFFANTSEGATDLQEEQKALFTSANSRWGMNVANGSKTTAKFEFDLDGAQSNGTEGMSNARVRQANLTYRISENATLTMGKKWTKFLTVVPVTYGATRAFFWSGNTGFMVDGIDYTRKMGATSFSFELANSGNDEVNLVSTPTMTALIGHKFGDHNVGLAHTTANLKYKTVADTNKDSTATGTKLFWKGAFGATKASLQYTMGSNLGSIQVGALGTAAAANDEEIKETTIMASVKHAFGEMSVFAGYGVDELAKEEEATDGGVSKNALMTLGFDKTLDAGLTVFVEHNMFTTSHYVAADDKSEDSTGTMTEIGMMYKF